jgi:hypothetical protein
MMTTTAVNNNELQGAEKFVEAECNSDSQENPLLL